MAYGVADTSRNCFQSSRAEDALRGLRQRLERHAEQEFRLGRLYRIWQDCWTTQHDQLRRQVERLEAHLATWMPQADSSPSLSLVCVGHEGE